MRLFEEMIERSGKRNSSFGFTAADYGHNPTTIFGIMISKQLQDVRYCETQLFCS
jgi:hypothetical protein